MANNIYKMKHRTQCLFSDIIFFNFISTVSSLASDNNSPSTQRPELQTEKLIKTQQCA